jgi:hypothetical protein
MLLWSLALKLRCPEESLLEWHGTVLTDQSINSEKSTGHREQSTSGIVAREEALWV